MVSNTEVAAHSIASVANTNGTTWWRCHTQCCWFTQRGRSSSNKRSSSWTPSNNSRNEAKSDPCHYHGNAHTWLKCYGNPDGPNYHPGFTPRPHGATCRGRSGFRTGHGNGGDRNDTYQNDAANNAGSNNNNVPSAASMVTNHTNASGWGAGNQVANNNTSCETEQNTVGNFQHPSTKSRVQSYRAPVPAYGQQQQLPMAEMNPPG
eukprot:scaffold39229_cov60-Attheya_sp.AAC.5